MEIRYSGARANGRIDGGIADPSRAPAEIAEELFRQGWRKASVCRNGEVVGGVRIIDGKRDWWPKDQLSQVVSHW